MTPVLLNLGAWHSYHYQHGSHRMGLPFLFTSYLMKVSNWDVRWGGYFAVGTLALATVLALALKRKLVGPIRFYDVVIPIVFLSPIHYEHTVQTASTSACIFPMFLILVFAGCITSQKGFIQYGCGGFSARRFRWPSTVLFYKPKRCRRSGSRSTQGICPKSSCRFLKERTPPRR